MKSFVLNDELKRNSYGFRTLNAGIDLSRFSSNPVMLDSHWGGGGSSVIGKWENIRIEGSQLLADPMFDEEDAVAANIKRKVEKGFLKGASMGLYFDPNDMKPENGGYVLEKSELVEASIVSIPSNANALKLYAKNGELLTKEAVELSIQGLISNQIQPTMTKIILSASTLVALGVPNTDDPLALANAIEKQVAEGTAAKAKLQSEIQRANDAEAKLSLIVEQEAKAVVDAAVTEGKITQAEHAHFLSMAKSNLEAAKTVLSKIPGKSTLGAQNTNTTEVKSLDDFMKLPDDKKLAFKAEHPEAYKSLFK
jgi:hypothetical protein